MSVTPYMNLTLPTVSATLGPLYATENNNAFGQVDSHNHTSGQGIQIPTAGINIDADLTFGSYNATALRSTRYTAQASPLALVTDLGCLFVSGVDLWYNDGNGVQIQLTASGALNAASIGGIGGDYATSTASVAYSDSTKTFKFLQDTNKSSLLDTGTILLRRTDITSSAAITLQTDTSLSVGWSLTLPTAPPASLSFMGMSSSGAISFPYTITTLATALSSTFITASLITKFTSSGTWTKATLNPKFIRVTVVGGGGAGGGASATGVSEGASGGGGGGGGCSIKTILAASLGATETVTVGTGGVAVSGNNCGSGTSSSFGSHASATGGQGGTLGNNTVGSTASRGGDGGLGASGDVNFYGSDGFVSQVISGSPLRTGAGGSSYLGGSIQSVNLTGQAGKLYGGGGSGAQVPASTTAKAGGNGAIGIVIVEEFY